MKGTFLGRFASGELGWKTVIAAGVILLIAVGQQVGWIPKEADLAFVYRIAEALGLVGLRDAMGKIKG